MGLVINPVRHADLVLQPIARDRVTLWRARKPLPDTLLCDPELLQTQAVLRKLKSQGSGYSRVIETSSLEVIARLTAEGMGVGVLPGRVARAYGGSHVTAIPGAPTYEDELFVVTHADNRGVRAIQAIAQGLKRTLKD